MESIYFKPPQGTVTFGGTITTTATLIDLREIDAHDDITINKVGDSYKFICFGMNAIEFEGTLQILLDNISSRFEFELIADCVDKDAKKIKSNGYYEKRWTYKGVHKRLIHT